MYLVEIETRQFIRTFKTKIMIILSLWAGLLLPVFCFASARGYQKQLDTFYFDGYKDTAEASWVSPPKSISYLEEMCRMCSGRQWEISIRCFDIVTSWNNANIQFYGVGEDYQHFRGLSIIRGRDFTSEELKGGVKVCMISQQESEQYECGLGDEITIRDQEYEVIGIINNYQHADNVILPYESIGQMYPVKLLQHTMLAKTDMPEEAVGKLSQYLESQEDVVSIVAVKEYVNIGDAMKEMVKHQMNVRMLIGIFLLVFSAINLVLLVNGTFQDKYREYAVSKAIGLTNRKLFAGFMIEFIWMTLIANVLLFITIHPVSRLFGLWNEMTVDGIVVLGTVTVSLFLGMVFSGILLLRFSRTSITEKLNREAS